MKNIIFDWSGVVKDAVASQLWITNKVFTKHGIPPISLEEFRDSWEQPYQLFYNKYLPNLSLEEEGRDYKEAIMSAECPKSNPCAGMVDLVKTFNDRGYYMIVVSSDHPESLLKEITGFGLEGIFKEVITGVHDKFDTVRDSIIKHNLRPEDTYFIGDSNHEVEVAKRLGIKSIAVTWGFCNQNRLESVYPDFLIDNIEDLKKVLL